MTVEPGLVVVDKPSGWTSHDVVARVRRLAGTRKVGHAGTLDPMATGVLVLGVERATRLLTYVVGADKEYTATVRLGAATTTDDADGEVLATADASAVTEADVRAAVVPLTGPIQQVPSAVSAIKVDGRRAYARVRAGEDVVLAARPVTVHAFEVLALRAVAPPDAPSTGPAAGGLLDVDVRVVCSSGTYVRALARDLGAALGVGGHLTALRRTRVGGYDLAAARTLEDLERSFAVVPLVTAARASFAVREVDAAEAAELSHGRRIPSAPAGPAGTREAPVAAVAPDGGLVALLADADGVARPVLVLRPA
nr:tRNA pseudouridine(55) synthase TruB [uncultured Actinotalea sp.]